MRKSRAPVRLRAHIHLHVCVCVRARARARACVYVCVCVCVRLVEYAEAPRERTVSSGCVRPREIPDFDIMEIAVSAYQLRARIYPVLEKHFRAVVARILYARIFERHVAMEKTNGSFVADDVCATSHSERSSIGYCDPYISFAVDSTKR